MATAVQIHRTVRSRSNDWITRTASPRTEALALFVAMKQKGETAELIRELIGVPVRIREKLRVFALMHPEERSAIELALRFRKRVAEEFERLIAVRTV